MSGVNKVILLGNLGTDPEVKTFDDGNKLATLAIATSEKFKDREGTLQERTEWHNVVLYKRLAELAEQYLSKGRQVYIEGKLRTRKWQDKDGNDRYTTEIVAREMTFVGGGNQSSGGSSNSGSSPSSAPKQSNSGTSNQVNEPEPGNLDDIDDDLPF